MAASPIGPIAKNHAPSTPAERPAAVKAPVSRTTVPFLGVPPTEAARASAAALSPAVPTLELPAPTRPATIVSAPPISRYEQAFLNSAYDDDDVQRALEFFDHLTDEKDAREYIGQKIRNNSEDQLARVGITPRDDEAIRVFARSGFDEADIETAFQVFDLAPDAMAMVGRMALDGRGDELAAAGITPLDDSALEAYRTSNYGQDAVARLQRELPAITSDVAAREWIGRRILDGEQQFLVDLGIPEQTRGRKGPAPEASLPAPYSLRRSVPSDYATLSREEQAFYAGGYEDEDVRAAMKEFRHLENEADARWFIGDKILQGNVATLEWAGIFPQDTEAVEAFTAEGYGPDDVDRAYEVFDFEAEAKARVGRMVLEGRLGELAELGITPRDDAAVAAFRASDYDDRTVALVRNGLARITTDEAAQEWIGQRILAGQEWFIDTLPR